MRKEFNVRIRLPQALGHEIHQLSLRGNRSQSATVSWLVTQQLDAMRARAAEQEELLRVGHAVKLESALLSLIKGVTDSTA
jgi:hypothetical protein